MACDRCSHCDRFKDLDWEDGYYLVNGEYWCTDCCMEQLTEAEFDYITEYGEVSIGTVRKVYMPEYGDYVWQAYVPLDREPGPMAFLEPEVDPQKTFDKWWDWREKHPPLWTHYDEPDEAQEWYDFDPEC